MKIRKTLLSFACAIMVALSFTACSDDWGRQDSPAGGQIYASKTTVATYDFEYPDSVPVFSDMISHDDGCELVVDDYLASNVLHLTGKGGAKIANPFNGVKLQNGAAITFAVKIDAEVAEDGTVASYDLTRPLFSFGTDANDADAAHFYFTANGQMVYEKAGQLQSLNLNENDPASVTTGMLTPNEWHFVALQVSNDGYQFYVDGKKSISGSASSTSATSFQYKSLVEAINTLPYLYIGGDSSLPAADPTNVVSIDNVTLIRNMMVEKDWNKTAEPGNVDTNVYVPVGTEDCSAAWWKEFSDYFQIPQDGTLHLEFYNYTSGANNWNNWCLCLSTDADRAADGYSEYFVIRADQYGWGDASYSGDNFNNEGYPTDTEGWTQFRKDMQGAKVVMDIQRKGEAVTVTAVATCENGTVYTEKYTQNCGTGNQTVRAFLIVDSSYLRLISNNCKLMKYYDLSVPNVGTADCTAAWWTQFSDYFQMPAGYTMHLNFTNNTSGVGNWNNWNLCVSTDAERDADGYSEYFVIRSDLYGWGSAYNGDNFSNEGYGDWDQFRKDMQGADVTIDLLRDNEGEVYVTATATATNKTVYTEMFHATCGDPSATLRAFLIVDGSYLQMKPSQCYLYKDIYDQGKLIK